jgi:dihydrofolate reductase
MGKVVVSQFVSADGVIEDPVGMETLGRGSWTSQSDSGADGGKFKVDEIMSAEAMLLGRVTYDGYASAWAARTGDYADKINSMPKYVVSATIQKADWSNSTVIAGDIPAEIAGLKDRVDGEILIHGSAQLVDTLLEDDLVDEWRLMVFPIIVGAGKRCFGDPGQARPLRLVESRSVGDGVAILVYRPARG